MKVSLLVNPAARAGSRGRRSPAVVAAEAVDRLREHGVAVQTLQGTSAAESAALVRRAIEAGTGAVAVAGGDGTVRVAVQQLAGSVVPLGIVPCGTGDDLATGLGLVAGDAAGAADVIAAGRLRSIDLLRVTPAHGPSTLVATVLACGFDARVNDRANAMRRPRGPSRYTIAIALEFLALRGIRFRVEVDGDTVADDDLVVASVGNGRTYGGGIPICPDADLADGLLDVTLARAMTRRRLAAVVPMLYRGTHVAAPEVSTFRGRTVRLDAPGVTAYGDGDPVGRLPLEASVVPRAIEVLVP